MISAWNRHTHESYPIHPHMGTRSSPKGLLIRFPILYQFEEVLHICCKALRQEHGKLC